MRIINYNVNIVFMLNKKNYMWSSIYIKLNCKNNILRILNKKKTFDFFIFIWFFTIYNYLKYLKNLI